MLEELPGSLPRRPGLSGDVSLRFRSEPLPGLEVWLSGRRRGGRSVDDEGSEDGEEDDVRSMMTDVDYDDSMMVVEPQRQKPRAVVVCQGQNMKRVEPVLSVA